jgi:alpha-glutamyl/putrescinyl thymine pyrophosphorylase clade 1
MTPWPAPLAELEPTIVFESYWKFVSARFSIYLHRLREEPPPWTSDPILVRYKFTNVFRATDRVSQVGIRISNDEISAASLEEQFFRILLFKLFNKIETWEALTEALREEPRLANFSFSFYNEIFEEFMRKGTKIYSSAYMMPCPADYGVTGITRKHAMHLHMLEEMLATGVAHKLKEAGNLKGAFTVLRKVRMFGDFTAYQFAIDVNYGPFLNYREDEFIVPGPGAEEGIKKCFANPDRIPFAEVIKRVTDYQNSCSLRVTGAATPTLFGRPLQLIDIQNCFCEIAKYARVAHPEFNNTRTRIKHFYNPREARSLPKPIFPRQWDIAYA